MRTAIVLATLCIAAAGCGQPIVDEDGDGFGALVDCDDANADVHPSAIEVCDEIDNDCDTLIDDADPDADVSSGTTYFRDRDSDGFGGIGQQVRACAPGPNLALVDTDCNDQDPDIHPGVLDICDGIDNDCDRDTVESGVTFIDRNGLATDLTDAFSPGVQRGSGVFELDQDGSLFLCDDRYYMGLLVRANVDIVGAASWATALDGAGTQHGVYVDAPVTVSISGLTLANFVDPREDFEVLVGSALHCSAGAVVVADDLVVVGNTSELGGAMSVVEGCDLTLTNTTFSGNVGDAGGHLAVSDASATLTDVIFASGQATAGGAVSVADVLGLKGQDGPFDPSDFQCQGCQFVENHAALGGAMFLYYRASAVVTASRFSHNSGLGGAVYLLGAEVPPDKTTLRLADVSFDDNLHDKAPSDVFTAGDGGNLFRYHGTSQTVLCDGFDGCG